MLEFEVRWQNQDNGCYLVNIPVYAEKWLWALSKRKWNYIRACILNKSISGSEYNFNILLINFTEHKCLWKWYAMRSPYIYIVLKYTFKINNAVIYYHIGSTCDPAGTLIRITGAKHSEFLW